MVVYKDDIVAERAAAQGMTMGTKTTQNTPDGRTPSGSGFNFRMSELQGAVGIAQLKKLDIIVEAQRERFFEIAECLEKFHQRISGSPSRRC